MRVAREELAGPGQRVELSGSQCSSSSIDRQSWWEEAFPCSCSPMSSSSMPMISRLTNRCSRSTIPMSSPSSLKVSEQIETTSLCLRIIVMFIFHLQSNGYVVYCFLRCQCCAQRQTSTPWWMQLEPSSLSVALICELVHALVNLN